MNLAPPSSVQKLQKALHDKAKESSKWRFHALYDKVYRKDVLAFAYACCKANGGAAGVDGQSFEDIEEYDSIPHAELLKSVARRVVDGAMLHLIKMWLQAPVEETDEHGRKHRSTRNRDEGRGTPQGAPISPLLSNL